MGLYIGYNAHSESFTWKLVRRIIIVNIIFLCYNPLDAIFNFDLNSNEL